VRNGLLPIVLPEAVVASLAVQDQANSAPAMLTVDLAEQVVVGPDGARHGFAIEPSDRLMLLEGLDAVGLTLQRLAVIRAFEVDHKQARPWLFARPAAHSPGTTR
jgi:3-isopropylmalate/(R)-2-methylmalate dehydratase small subunit